MSVRAYGVDKFDKGPREVLNRELQKVRLIANVCPSVRVVINSLGFKPITSTRRIQLKYAYYQNYNRILERDWLSSSRFEH